MVLQAYEDKVSKMRIMQRHYTQRLIQTHKLTPALTNGNAYAPTQIQFH